MNNNRKNDLKIDPRLDYKTYNDYKKFYDNPTKPYLMISELIDNSIASWLKNNSTLNGLVIELEINFTNDENTSYISCLDNAYGMNAKELQEAVKINKIQKSKNVYNVHGRGLKQSAFYFGKKLEIFTNNGRDSSTIIIDIPDDQIELEKPAISDPEATRKQKERGTQVLFKRLYHDRNITNKNINLINQLIGWRYGLAIRSDNLIIKIKHKQSHKWKESTKIEPFLPDPALFKELWPNGISPEISSSIKESIEKSYKNLSESDASNNKIEKSYADLRDKLKKYVDVATPEMEVKFKWDTIWNNKDVQLNFGWMPKGDRKMSGITIYEGKRAIYHGPNNDESPQVTWWTKFSFESGSPEFSFIGDIDFTNYVQPSTDKSSLSFTNEQKEELDRIVNAAFRMSKPIMKASRLERGKKQSSLPNEDVVNDAKLITSSKYNPKRVKLLNSYNDENKVSFIHEYELKVGHHEERWKVKIEALLKISEEEETLYRKEFDENNHFLFMTVYVGHSFWKRANVVSRQIFYDEILFPFSLLFANIEILHKCDQSTNDPIEDINSAIKVLY